MALKSTVYNLELSISDMTRNYYADHRLTLAKHPSETDLRLLLRIVAFSINACEYLQFTKGLSNVDEPDLWEIDLTGRIRHWIDLGQPIEKRIRQACGKADRVSIYTYQPRAANMWFEGIREELERFEHLRVVLMTVTEETAIEKIVQRSMRLTCTIEDEQVMLISDTDSLIVNLETLKASEVKWANTEHST